MEIDHLFIFCSPNAPEAEVLEAFGFKEGEGRTHTGQGTANRRFFFGNTYLELLYVVDESQLQSEQTKMTRLDERFCHHCSDISPFGICFKSIPNDEITTQYYQPAYLPEGYQLALATSNPLSEPLWFFIQTPESVAVPYQSQQMMDVDQLDKLTNVTITTSQGASLSSAAKTLMLDSCLSLLSGLTPLMELTFDNGAKGLSQDFRPALPLVVNW